MTFNDPWVVLGIKPGSSEEDIKKAYKALAMQYHPDVNDDPEANTKMTEINLAFAEVMKLVSPTTSRETSYGGYTTVDDLIASMMQSFTTGPMHRMWKFKVVKMDVPSFAVVLYALTTEEAKTGKDVYLYKNGVNLKVHIPAGVMDRQQIRLPHALKVTDGIEGDIIIKVRVVGGG
jgi:hypothetical protein